MTDSARARDLATKTADCEGSYLRAGVDRLIDVSLRGLSAMYDAKQQSFPQTARGPVVRSPLQLEGVNVRYAAIAALGLSRVAIDLQKATLSGDGADGLLSSIRRTALAGSDPGAVALAGWASAEMPPSLGTSDSTDDLRRLFDRICHTVDNETPIPTVDHSWQVTALVAAAHRASADDTWAATVERRSSHFLELAERAADRLRAAQGDQGVFPHHLPAAALSRFRSHVGCFADQVYPIQALSRLAAATGNRAALEAATNCAQRICMLQGPAGQWWWHYDARTGAVVEGYPVYSVHQHGMAPMVLFELHEAGGPDFGQHIVSGLGWIFDPPETREAIVRDDLGVIWRKVGRREPRKLLRSVRSISTSLHSGARLGPLDYVFPPGPVDRECRPYELGWLLYAWLGAGLVSGAKTRSVGNDPVAL